MCLQSWGALRARAHQCGGMPSVQGRAWAAGRRDATRYIRCDWDSPQLRWSERPEWRLILFLPQLPSKEELEARGVAGEEAVRHLHRRGNTWVQGTVGNMAPAATAALQQHKVCGSSSVG